MKLEQIIVGPLQSNCYIIYDEESREGMVIDPGDEAEKIVNSIEQKKLRISYIVCTHAHFDHIGALSRLKGRTGAQIVLHRDELEIYEAARDQGAFWGCTIEQPPKPDIFVREGDTLTVAKTTFEVLHTPGHSPGGICLYGAGILLSGDTVFAGSVGRTDFFGGNTEDLKKSFKRIISLPPETHILPGHGDPSTISAERELNFFVQEL